MCCSASGASGRRALLALLLLLVAAAAGVSGEGGDAASSDGGGEGGTLLLDARLPPFPTKEPDEYLCTSLELPARPLKLTGVQALAKKEIVHHILLYGCETPAKQEKVWSCRMMRACGSGQEAVLFGWGKDAPGLQLPEGVGFAVGPGTGIRTVVMQVHYLPLRPEDDSSGVCMTLTESPTPLSAGMVSFASAFEIPPGRPSTLVPNECCYSGFEPLHGFGFRVHAHWMGRSIYGELNAPAAGAPFARQDPQLPQGFYAIDPLVRILPGDRLRATCDFDSANETRVVRSGYTSKDEMCNLYMMIFSQVPYFMYCIDSKEYVALEGAGGLPQGGKLQLEAALWQPPKTVELEAQAEAVQVQVPVGQVAGVAAGANGTVWVLHRGERTWRADSFDSGNRIAEKQPLAGAMVLQLDQDTGKVLRSWGSGEFFMPHMITPDLDGNVWITDVGLHQAIKYSPDGRRLLELGTRMQPGSGPNALCKPTHVAVARDGSVFVADGYCNSRVVKFHPNGTYVGEFKLPAGRAQLSVPHSLALHECKGLLYLADREGGAVHALTFGPISDAGALAGSWDVKEHGLPYAVAVGPYGRIVVLAWQRGADGASGPSRLVVLDGSPGTVNSVWELPTAVGSPHDLAIVAAPPEGAHERRVAALVAETRPAGQRSLLHKLVFAVEGSSGGGGAAGAAKPPGAEDAAGAQQPAGLAASHMGNANLRAVDGAAGGSSAPSSSNAAAATAQSAAALVAAAAGKPGWPKAVQQQQQPTGASERAALGEQAAREGSLRSALTKSSYLGVVLGCLVAGAAALLLARLTSWRRGYTHVHNPVNHVA